MDNLWLWYWLCFFYFGYFGGFWLWCFNMFFNFCYFFFNLTFNIKIFRRCGLFLGWFLVLFSFLFVFWWKGKFNNLCVLSRLKSESSRLGNISLFRLYWNNRLFHRFNLLPLLFDLLCSCCVGCNCNISELCMSWRGSIIHIFYVWNLKNCGWMLLLML